MHIGGMVAIRIYKSSKSQDSLSSFPPPFFSQVPTCSRIVLCSPSPTSLSLFGPDSFHIPCL
jgi:hypothetical protein